MSIPGGHYLAQLSAIRVHDEELACRIGLREACFVAQLAYWLDRSTNAIEGEFWVYKTLEEWQFELYSMSYSTIRRIIQKLEKMEVIKSGEFNTLKMDRTKWYTINFDHECWDMSVTHRPQTKPANGLLKMDSSTPAQNEQVPLPKMSRSNQETTYQETTTKRGEERTSAPAQDMTTGPPRVTTQKAMAWKENWKALPMDWYSYATERNLPPADTFDEFRDYYLASPKRWRNWRCVWQRWCRKAAEDAQKAASRGRPSSPAKPTLDGAGARPGESWENYERRVRDTRPAQSLADMIGGE